MKHKTTRNRRHNRQSVLEVRVMSPRIAWFGFLRLLGKLVKVACVLAALAGIGWGVWRGVQHAFYQNPDFRLQVIDLNPNPVIDEGGVVQVLGIDLTACPSLFEIDAVEASRKLKALPAITDAQVERHLPGSLVVRVFPRSPKAWISCKDGSLPQVRRAGAMLVDHEGIAYPCPELQLTSASSLPVIELPASAEHPIIAGSKIPHPALEYCLLLLDAARKADPDAIQWIESIRQVNEWSLELLTRQGTAATFSLGDHPRQIENLRAALDHAGEKGYNIETINLIPKHNIPITIREGEAPPRAILVTPKKTAGDGSRRDNDLGAILNRN
jgi:cell division septal protein FtsQ